MMHKPQVKSSSSREPPASSGDCDGNDDNVPVRQEELIRKRKKKRRISDTSGMIRGLRADTNSPYWESQKGELPATEGMGSIRSRQGEAGPSNTSNSDAMVSAVYMVEAGLNMYKSAMESDEACEWQDAIDSECASLKKNKVLMFVREIPEMKKAIPTKLILQRKLNPVGRPSDTRRAW